MKRIAILLMVYVIGVSAALAEQNQPEPKYSLSVRDSNSTATAEENPSDPNRIKANIMQKAEMGDANAQVLLAACYDLPIHPFEQDHKQAVYWYRKAAEQGEVLAQYWLGGCYANGRGVEQDHKQSFYWYRKAAEQGHVTAQFNLGLMYGKGDGVSQDDKEAFKWFIKAAEQGYADAQFHLGWMYAKGNGVSQDDKEALKWSTKAAEQGLTEAQYNLGWMYYEGRGVLQNYKEAFKWFTKAAEQGIADAQYNLGAMYVNGDGVTQNYKEAIKWFTIAAEQGYAKAQFSLGICYWNGEGVIEDYVEAYRWFLLAGMNGEDVADRKAALQEKLSPAGIEEGQKRAREFVKQQEANKEDGKEKSDVADIMPTLKSSGTAFCIHSDGFFLTSAHIVQGAESIKLWTEKGLFSAAVISFDDGLDIALLKVSAGGFAAIPLLSSSAVKTGDKVFTIGFPNIDVQGFEPKYTEGVISSLSGIQNNPRFFQISVAVQPGNSGGPLVDEKGRVIGIVTAKLDDIASLAATGSIPQNVNYAVKSSFILPLFEGIEELKEIPKPAELTREDGIKKTKSAVGLVMCY